MFARYNTRTLERMEVQDVQYIACMNPASGSFFGTLLVCLHGVCPPPGFGDTDNVCVVYSVLAVNSRLQRHFAAFSCDVPSEDILQSIYTVCCKRREGTQEISSNQRNPSLC